MVEGGPRLLAEAQRDVAGQEFGLGIVLVVAGPAEHQPIGGFGIAGPAAGGPRMSRSSQEAAGLSLRADPEQQFGGGVDRVLFAPPARLLEGEPGIVAQRLGDLGDQLAAAGGIGGEGQAGFGKRPVIGRDQRQHARAASAWPSQSSRSSRV